jgi:hypothetical protein
MIPDDLAAEYRRLNAVDHRWGWAITVAGAAALLCLIILAIFDSGDRSGSTTTQKQQTIVHAHAQ